MSRARMLSYLIRVVSGGVRQTKRSFTAVPLTHRLSSLFFLQPFLLTMIARLSNVTFFCVLSLILGVSQSVNLRGHEQEEKQMRTIDLLDPVPHDFEEMLRDFDPSDPQHRELKKGGGGGGGGELRCVDGGDYKITIGMIDFGTCDTLHPCLCGISPANLALYCPKQCRPSCGGTCAFKENCPNGFAIKPDGTAVAITDVPFMGYTFWPSNMGPGCPFY